MDWIRMTRDGMSVQRNHTWSTIHSQSVGEHTANVLCIIMRVYARLELEPSFNLITATLYHDLAEQATGDCPATIKISDGSVKAALDLAESRFNRHWNIDIGITEDERWILKFADMFEFALYCKEELRLGNTLAHSRWMRGFNILKVQVANSPNDTLWKIADQLLDEAELK